jgi:membrane protease YdiL (CAAX protease family)
MHLGPNNTANRDIVVPLVRLEGAIDSHGLELAELTGFSQDRFEETSRSLDRLREPELSRKRHGQWDRMEPLDFVSSQLQAFDRMVYPADYFEAFRGIEELAKVELTENRIAVVCRCDCGIYELEKELKRLYGKRLGLIVLQKSPRSYTLRQVDPFLPVNLEKAYRKLNLLDPAVRVSDAADRWGGSAEIGGSPRKAGTDLSPDKIAGVLRLVYRKQSALERATSIGSAVVASGVPMLAGWLAVSAGERGLESVSRGLVGRQGEFLAAGLALSLILLIVLGSRGRRRLYGLRWPEGRWWGLVAPAVMLGAVAGGVWSFGWSLADGGVMPQQMTGWLCLFGFPLLAEITFRGLAHGLLMNSFSIQYSRGRWFVSWPVAVSALLYAAWTIPFSSMTIPAVVWPGLAVFVVPVTALICGLGLGIVRERSGSLLSSLAVHWLAVGTAIVAAGWLSS